MLEVSADAPVDEIKRAFRREIAKYHPDKVQHLGKEFQDIAAVKAAELTQAYKTLTDASLRAEYDELLRTGGTVEATPAPPAGEPASPQAPKRDPEPARPHAQTAPRPAHAEPAAPPPPMGSVFSQDRAASRDLIEQATKARYRQAVAAEFGTFETPRVEGFEMAVIPKPPFWKFKLPPRVLG